MTIPKRYEEAKWDDVPASVQEGIKSAIADKKGVYLHGPVGCGKTHVMYAFAKHWEVSGGKPMKVWNVTELIHAIQRDFDSKEKLRPELDLQEEDGPIILDDLGAEKMTEWVQQELYLILNRRYNNMAMTFITSNLSPTELEKKIGDRITSRIIGTCEVIALDGEDKRIK